MIIKEGVTRDFQTIEGLEKTEIEVALEMTEAAIEGIEETGAGRVKITLGMIGFVANVVTPIFHLGQNVTDVVHPRVAAAEVPLNNGLEMTEELVTETILHNRGQATGNVVNVRR